MTQPLHHLRYKMYEQGAGGIGDGLLGLTAIAGLQQESRNHVIYSVSSIAHPWVELFTGYSQLDIMPPNYGDHGLNAGYWEEQKEKHATPRWERYAKNVGTIQCIIPPLRDPNTIRIAGEDLKDHIILCPFSTNRTREWSTQHWLTLERMLLDNGYRTIVVGTDDRMDVFKSKQLRLVSPTRLAGAMVNSLCVVAIDSGPAHLAGILKQPVVILGGQIPIQKVFDIYPGAYCIQGGLDCTGCSGNDMLHDCSMLCASIQTIHPNTVFAAIQRVSKQTLCSGSILTQDRLTAIRKNCLGTENLSGDIAEFGVYKGGVAKLLSTLLPNTPIHLFDTFTGIPEDDVNNGYHKKGDFSHTSLESVKRFVNNPWAHYHPGWFPENVPDVQYKFVHVDADIYQSTVAALDYFVPRMIKGGCMVFDDYKWKNCLGVERALHERFNTKRIEQSAPLQATVRF